MIRAAAWRVRQSLRSAHPLIGRAKWQSTSSWQESTQPPPPPPPSGDHTLPHFRQTIPDGKESDIENRLLDGGSLYVEEDPPPLGVDVMANPVYTPDELSSVEITHRAPRGFVDHYAYYSVQALRLSFDITSGYKFGRLTEDKWLTRIIYLESVAAVPGMVGGMVRHLQSLRRMRRDAGWIHTLLEEAENERMHLMTALLLKRPSALFRFCVLLTQGVFTNVFFLTYLFSPRYCHRFVGYLEEEAVITYTRCIADLDAGLLPLWTDAAAPDAAKRYWHLHPEATVRDMLLAIRADEAHHRLVNHTLASLQRDKYNPFRFDHSNKRPETGGQRGK